MSVTIPDSGAVIEKATIEAMHQVARAKANAVPVGALRRDTFGPQHLPGILVGKGSTRSITGETVSNIPLVFNQNAANQALWTVLPSYVTTGATVPPCILVYGCSMRFEKWNANTYDARTQLWATIWYRKAGVRTFRDHNSKMMMGQKVNVLYGDWKETEEWFTMYDFIDFSAEAGSFTLNDVGVSAAINPGGGTAAPGNATIKHGSMWWKAYYRQS